MSAALKRDENGVTQCSPEALDETGVDVPRSRASSHARTSAITVSRPTSLSGSWNTPSYSFRALSADPARSNNSWLPPGLVARSAVPWRMRSGRLMPGSASSSRSSARTIAATVIVGCVSLRNQRILVHRRDDRAIAREVLVLQAKHVRMRREVAEPLEYGQRDARRREAKGKALANQSGQLRLVLEGVEAGHDAARAVAEEKDREILLPRLHDRGQRRPRR